MPAGDTVKKIISNAPLAVAVCTFLAIFGSTYVASGFPVPASKTYVDERLVPLKESLKQVKVLIISNSLDQLDTRKGILRAERIVIEQTLTERIDLMRRSAFNNRIGQINDDLLAIERRKDELSKRTDDIEKTP
jgi:hypothetical protein